MGCNLTRALLSAKLFVIFGERTGKDMYLIEIATELPCGENHVI